VQLRDVLCPSADMWADLLARGTCVEPVPVPVKNLAILQSCNPGPESTGSGTGNSETGFDPSTT
jgi:hypothetical protein